MHFSIGKTTSYKSIKRACSLRLVQFNFILGPSTITFAGYDATIKCCVICIIFITTGELDELQSWQYKERSYCHISPDGCGFSIAHLISWQKTKN